MRIKSVKLSKFKRFDNLSIGEIPKSARLVVLLGPNGCGKSSLFDAFRVWHERNGFPIGFAMDDDYLGYYFRNFVQGSPRVDPADKVKVEFYEDIATFTPEQKHQFFYLRTAYRNSPEIKIQQLNRLPKPTEKRERMRMILNDSTVEENYQRLVARTLARFYDRNNNEKKVEALRDELIGRIREPLSKLFPDLLFTEIGVLPEKPEFYFDKGEIHHYGYEKLSGGEKAAFDLLLDFIIKSEYFQNTVFCIDEPETHIHTALQARLLSEMFSLLPDQSQLWIATHSFGMLKEARRLSQENPGEVVFLNFDGHDFDDEVHLEPSDCDQTLWKKMLEITLDNYAQLVLPEVIVFCEGDRHGKKNKTFDQICYTNIFAKTRPNVMFYSMGGCETIDKDSSQMFEFLRTMSPETKFIRILDRDDRSDDEIERRKSQKIKVLRQRDLENYLLDDEVLKAWCLKLDKPELVDEVLKIKYDCFQELREKKGILEDDIKSASKEICVKIKNKLGAIQCGNSGVTIMMDTLSKLITPEMKVYKMLDEDIFGEIEQNT